MKEVERLRAAQGSEKHTAQCVEIALLLGHAGFPEDIPIQEAVRQLIQRVRGDKMNLTELVKRLVKAEADIQRSGRAETLRDEKAYSDGKAAGIRYALAEIKQTQINEVTDVIIAYFEGLKAPVPSTLNNPDCPPGLAAVRDYLAAPQGAEKELQRWRTWAQFIYLGGGTVSGTDDELRAGVCSSHHKQVLEARAEAAPQGAGWRDTVAKYQELIYAVGNKHQGENRHETALRYIRQAEMHSGGPASALPVPPDPGTATKE